MRKSCLLALSALLLGPTIASAGFIQTGAGPHDYNNTANWAGGVIDGSWPSTLTLAAAQRVTFATDTALSTPLDFSYTGNVALTLDSSSATPHTITLGGDITVNPVSNQTVTIGTVANPLNVNLGGPTITRTFNVNASKILTFRNTLSNGDILVTGGGTVRLAGTAPTSNATVSLATLNLDSSLAGATGGTRLQTATLAGGTLSATGNNTADSIDAVNGAITLEGATGGRGINFITVTPNANKNAQLTASSLLRSNNAVVSITGTNLGNAPGNGVANVRFLNAQPATVGGNAPGTANTSIIPWAVGGNVSNSISSFVTYENTGGVRALNTATEYFDATAASFDSFNNANNIRIFNSTAGNITSTVANATTVNSLWLQSTGTGQVTVSGGGTINVTSGAVVLSANGTVAISTPLNFGSVQGVIGYTRGKVTQINNAISGSGGLILYQLASGTSIQGSGGTGIALSTTNTYSGDTYLFGRLDASNGVLPNATRTGDVYNYGLLNINNVAQVTINGLNGDGVVSRTNGTGTLSIGDNNANGNFSGSINLAANATATLNVTKILTGTQTLSGTNLYLGATSITGGTLALVGSGSINSTTGITVNGAGATFKTNSSVPVTKNITITNGTIGGTGTVSAPAGVSIGANATISPGNSPGSQSYTTGLTWAPLGTYLWEINDANGTAGTNFDQLVVTSGLQIPATNASKFTIDITGLTAGNAIGAVPNFNNTSNYAWLIADADTTTGFAADKFTLDTTDFAASNPLGSGTFSIHTGNESVPGVTMNGDSNDIYLVFTGGAAIPEPTSLGILALGAIGLLHRRRRA